MELCDVGTEQLTGLPLCQQQDLSGHACCDIGITIPITADPAGYFDRRPIRAGQRQRVGVTDRINLPEKLRHRIPERIFNHCESPARLINRGRSVGPELLGMPDLRYELGYSALRLLPRHITLNCRVERIQAVAQRPMFVNERTAGDFSGVRSKYQVNVQFVDRRLNLRILRLGLQYP